ncbi:hypothetical protein RHMOL_Rhmol02G0218400 [Rhododendron molle]|uniref:Uncharacterized protein n=1 Tax=Rhododendron molle TaxID=49168 RepID=A0ACC0PSE0_RHOML|nr:hypothetical protein RHMOL_Rhmol02G0218400 [Rhododendron molle]
MRELYVLHVEEEQRNMRENDNVEGTSMHFGVGDPVTIKASIPCLYGKYCHGNEKYAQISLDIICSSLESSVLFWQPHVSAASVNLATETAIVWPVSEAKVVPNWQKKQELGLDADRSRIGEVKGQF